MRWYNCLYTVNANSEEEARDVIESGYPDAVEEYSDYDTTDQIDIEAIEEISE